VGPSQRRGYAGSACLPAPATGTLSGRAAQRRRHDPPVRMGGR
jgi:hypothetical protein